LRIIVLTLFFILLFSSDICPQSRTRPAPLGRLLSTSSALNPDGPAAPDSIVAIRGMRFTDDEAYSCCATVYEIAGVRAWIGDEPQPIVSATPEEIRIVPSVFSSWIVVKAQDGRIGYAVVRMSATSPAIFITGEPDSDLYKARRPLAFYFDDQGRAQPVDIEPIPLPAPGNWRIVFVFGSGWRAAKSMAVRLGGIQYAALDWSPFAGFLGQDQLAIAIPGDFPCRGEVEMVIEADGPVSNPAMIRVE
jgi:uncharacterized protein (TIGR03437 family)